MIAGRRFLPSPAKRRGGDPISLSKGGDATIITRVRTLCISFGFPEDIVAPVPRPP